MSGGEIKNVLTLDISKFESAAKKAADTLDKLDNRLEKVSKVSGQLDKSVSTLSSGMAGVSSTFQVLDRVVGNVSKRLDASASSVAKIGKAGRKAGDDLKKLVDSAEKMESIADWTAHYGKALDKLNPLIGKVSKSHAEMDKEFKSQAKNAKASAEEIAKARIKALKVERDTNAQAITDRKKMIAELAKIEERANITASVHTKEANRYRGKNASSPKRSEALSLASSAKAEAVEASKQRSYIESVVKELNWKNQQLRQGVIESMKEVRIQRELAALDKERAEWQRKMAKYAKDYRNEQKRTAKENQQGKNAANSMVASMSKSGGAAASAEVFLQAFAAEKSAWAKHYADLDRQAVEARTKTAKTVQKIMTDALTHPESRASQSKFYEGLWGSNGIVAKSEEAAREKERQAWRHHWNSLEAIKHEAATKTVKQANAALKKHQTPAVSHGDRQKIYESLWGENGSEAKAQRAAQQAAVKAQALAERLAKKKADAELRELARVEREREAAARREERRIRDAEKARIKSAKEAARAEKQAAAETADMWKSIGTMYAGVQTARGIRGGTNAISEYELASKRIDLFNLPDAENKEFKQKASDLTKENTLLTQKDSLLLRGDAMSALGYNNTAIIDQLMPAASKAATALNALGYDKGDPSTIMKNLWGTIELLGQQYDPEEAKKTIDAVFKAAVVSQGKVTIQDIETFLRNAGSSGRGMTTEGLQNIIPLLEMFKTAGGGSGGGSGVARVGTMIKMISAYANGKSLKNEGVDQLLGSGVLNAEFDQMTVEQFRSVEKKNIQMMKQLKTAGLKDADLLVEDPVKFVQNLRKPMLEFMMRDENFSHYFAGREKFSYNDKGQMVNKDGAVVNLKDQDRVEIGAFSKFFNAMGMSQNSIDGLVVNMMASSIIRNEHIQEQMKAAAGAEEAFGKLMDTWAANTIKLKTAAMNMAVAFEPVLDLAGKFVNWGADVINSITGVLNGDNGFAKFVTVFGLVAGAAGLAMRPIRLLVSILQKFSGPKKAVGDVAGAVAKVGEAAKPTSSLVGKIFSSSILAGAAGFFGVIKAGPALLAGLRVGVGLLGGPLGIVASALITGASLWLDWGNEAETALQKAKGGFKNVKDLADRVQQDPSVAIGQLPFLDKQYEEQLAAYNESRAGDDARQSRGGGRPTGELSVQSKQILNRLNEIDRLRVIAHEQEAKKRSATVGSTDKPNTITTPASGAGAGGSTKTPRSYQDMFQISLEQLKGNAAMSKLEMQSLMAGETNYDKQAEVAFVKAWMTGKFDDGKEQSKRPFLKAGVKWDPERTYTADDIDMKAAKKSGSVDGWKSAWMDDARGSAELESLRFARGKEEAAANSLAEALVTLRAETEGQSESFQALSNQFARHEGKNPSAIGSVEYRQTKANTLAGQASLDATTATRTMKAQIAASKASDSSLSEYRQGINKAVAAQEKEQKAMDAIMGNLRKTILEQEAVGATTSSIYTDAMDRLKEMEPVYAEWLTVTKEAIAEAKKTAVEKTFESWTKLEDRYNEMAQGWQGNIANTLSGVINGDGSKVDIKAFLGTVASDMSTALLKSSLAKASSGVFGSTSFFEQGQNIVQGSLISGGGWLGDKLNQWRGLSADGLTSGMGANGSLSFTDTLSNAFNDLTSNLGGFGTTLQTFAGSVTGSLGDAFEWLKGGLGDFTDGLFEGDSALGGFASTLLEDAMKAIGKFASSLMGGATGEGGLLSGVASWVGGFFAAANGATFTGVKAFAKGGTFTNGIYNSPTAFKFANGGAFVNGVMGEAGPEAVMPLSRDSSGRLGVNVNGGQAGAGDTNVAITINVQSDGSSSAKSKGEENDSWRMIANRVKGVVVQEIVNQKRPGGALY